MTKMCVDLFSGESGFSAAFEDSDGWDVFSVEINPSQDSTLTRDVFHVEPDQLPEDPELVLASPPCTYFSTAGNHDSWDGKRTPQTPEARRHIALVFHTVGLIEAMSPSWWFLENPRGRLRWYLGPPNGEVTYCQYGRDYMKPTDLWGEHPPGMRYKSCRKGEDCHDRNLEDDGTAATASMPNDYGERSKVPRELSEEILRAVEAYNHEHPTLQGDIHG